MNVKVLAAIVLAVVVALPATTAYASPIDSTIDSTDALNVESDTVAQEEGATATESGSSEASSSGESTEEAEEYTKLYVDSDHRYPEIKPGETTTVNVTVQNAEDSAVTVDPHLYVPPVGGREQQIQKSWVTIEGDTTIEAGAEQSFTVTISVPEDAKIGHYGGQIAFTNETVTYPGRPARPVHATSINVEVWRQPTVEIVSNRYLRGQIEAGDSVTRQIVVKNTGDESVPVNPQFANQRNVRHGGSSSQVDPAWVSIDAPNHIAAGETGVITVTVSPPKSAENGRYRGELDLGLKDPARRDQNNYWQRVDMSFEIWSQPEEPFQTSFAVSEDTENVSLTVSPRGGYLSGGSNAKTNFDVVFVNPDGERIEADRAQLTDRGFVDLSDQPRGDTVEKQGEYSVRGVSKEFVYRIDDPTAGEWTVEIMPENTIGFNYEIVRNEAVDSTNETA